MRTITIVVIVVIIIIILWIIFAQSSKPSKNLPIIDQVDLNRYQGLWYEVARLPVVFQRGCVNSTANYTLNENKTMHVVNQCDVNGNTITATGTAYPNYPPAIEGTNIYPGSFTVKFDEVYSANDDSSTKISSWPGLYQIIYLDPEYQYAMVGDPSRQNLWILSRTPKMDSYQLSQLMAFAANLGFPVNDMIIN